MIERFVCLANSYKTGGRCLAGILLNDQGKPIMLQGRPRWIRPVSQSEHGEVATELVSDIDLLDIVEINTSGFIPNSGYQSENAFFKEDSIDVADQFDLNDLTALCEEVPLIFGNRGKAVHPDRITELDHSLILIKVIDFEFIGKEKENGVQTRIKFEHQDTRYDLAVTDPNYYGKSPQEININSDKLFLTLSLGTLNSGWYSKLVAGIIPG